ncbi:hypothetical protein PENANT_c019G04396 [Penicillium antarcticum]|uniref:RING-type domain-containing protein n=1 Tax=Penicillium antarcticum TaxID=416450 RepID=A0A1V6Q0T1_9EURO|nr:hypothetical protein PENANT_c019G04396 [Penicillium antarcticum]
MAADAPSLMDIVSTLAQDDIPFKLRCAICNKLAVDAFRLPCCDQSICEPCQTSLPDTCPVCAHTPVSPDLCKPNKALRTTLKAFLRTEEKKREKDRQAAITSSPATPVDPIPAQEAGPGQNGEDTAGVRNADAPVAAEPQSENLEVEDSTHPTQESAPDPISTDAVEQSAPPEVAVEQTTDGADQAVEPNEDALNAEPPSQDPPAPQDAPDTNSAAMTPNMGGFSMGWNGNGMNPYMTGMFNFPNAMGMPMGMDPMANQGIFGDYGMNMTGMGMNAGNFNGGMYGSLGWDAQNNMWQGQDNINPNAFANGTGPPYGGAYGSNIYPDQSAYYGSGYGRGAFRGRGRGYGRGFGPVQGHYANSGYAQGPMNVQGNQNHNPNTENTGQTEECNPQPIDGVPNGGIGNMGYRHGRSEGPGVEGAPAAPRAMRQGLPNTSVLRLSGRASDDLRQTPLNDACRETRSRSPGSRASRAHSSSANDAEYDQENRREPELKRMDRVDELQSDAQHTRSPSRASSRRSSRHRQHGSDREKDRNGSLRSHRSRRHRSRDGRSRSRASSRNGDARSSGRLHRIARQTETNGRTKAPFEAPEQRDLTSRINSSYRPDKDRGSRRENDRTQADRDSRRRDRDRDRERDRHPRERDTQRDSRKDGTRDKDRTSEREWNREHPRERDRDRKRSRRERSPSTNGNDHQSRRLKREDEDHTRNHVNGSVQKTKAEKDPYTLEREKRNKERLEREEQHRSQTKSGRRRDSRQDRQDRVVAGRRINYKYEDEL